MNYGQIWCYKGDHFNGDISLWNVSSVITMNAMFKESGNFAQNLNAWDVSSVTDMEGMFGSVYFTNDRQVNVSEWDVSSVTTF